VTKGYSITSSARASSDVGSSRSSAFARFKLMISSYLVGACTGRSAGFLPDSHADTWVEFTRVTYFAEFANRPLVIEADLPFATLTDMNIPGTNNQVAGGLVDPVFHLTYFFISDAKVQRWFGFTNFWWLPWGRNYDNRSAVNVSTPRQFTDTPSSATPKDLESFRQALMGCFLI
jgi:hypothetical protein